jgi:hypothetical protein
MACRRRLSSVLLCLIGTKLVVACGKKTYKLNLKEYTSDIFAVIVTSPNPIQFENNVNKAFQDINR